MNGTVCQLVHYYIAILLKLLKENSTVTYTVVDMSKLELLPVVNYSLSGGWFVESS